MTNNIKDSFNYNEEFLEFCTEGFILIAAMKFMGTNDLSEDPIHLYDDDKLLYLQRVAAHVVNICFVSPHSMVNKILDIKEDTPEQFCICKIDIPGSTMIYCANRHCERGVWFHLECMEMEEDDVPDGDWFCSEDCKEQKGRRRGRKKTSWADKQLDQKSEYTKRVMWRGLNQKCRKDALRENDGALLI